MTTKVMVCELVACVVAFVEDVVAFPPHPTAMNDPANRIKPKQAENQTFRDFTFVRAKNKGKRRNGSRMPAVVVFMDSVNRIVT